MRTMLAAFLLIAMAGCGSEPRRYEVGTHLKVVPHDGRKSAEAFPVPDDAFFQVSRDFEVKVVKDAEPLTKERKLTVIVQEGHFTGKKAEMRADDLRPVTD